MVEYLITANLKDKMSDVEVTYHTDSFEFDLERATRKRKANSSPEDITQENYPFTTNTKRK